MSKIRIKNFGPIITGCQDNDGWIDVPKVTVFIGNQGSGKSTIAKLISTFAWIEKALVRGDHDIKWFLDLNWFNSSYIESKQLYTNKPIDNPLWNYHRIGSYLQTPNSGFPGDAEIEYIGDAYKIKLANEKLEIEAVSTGKYLLPQIMYVPAERNFISYVKSPKELRLTSDSLADFITEFYKAKNEIRVPIYLPINNVQVIVSNGVFDNEVYIHGNTYQIQLTDASSGLQSFVPLYLVSWFLAQSVKKQSTITKESMSNIESERFKKGVAAIMSNESLSDEQRRIALSVLAEKFNKTAFINIVEEPEQNLFPTSQWEMLKSLLEFNNMNEGNRLIMTTHSPYIINYLSVAIQAADLKIKIQLDDLRTRLHNIIPAASTIAGMDVAIYELDEKTGTITKLPDYQGIPSDENYLNKRLVDTNEMFDALLEIKELCK